MFGMNSADDCQSKDGFLTFDCVPPDDGNPSFFGHIGCTTEDLTHVSPKSGRAVSRSAAQPYLDRRLPLPNFLTSRGNASPDDIANAFKLTGHFLDMHVWAPREIAAPSVREALIASLTKHED